MSIVVVQTAYTCMRAAATSCSSAASSKPRYSPSPHRTLKVDGMAEGLPFILENHGQGALQGRAMHQHGGRHPLWLPLPGHHVDLPHCAQWKGQYMGV